MRRLLVIGCLAAVAKGRADIDLAGTWRLEQADNPSVTCPIEVPGDVQSALFKAKLMPDPFWGRNEQKVQDVGRKDWSVSRTFEVDDGTLAKKALVLRLEDVDTFATVSLNGHELGKTDNSFTLLPNQPKTIEFKPKGEVSETAFGKALSVRHLRQTY